MLTVPLAAEAELTDSVSPSRSVSFERTSTTTAVSSSVLTASTLATGPSLTALTVTETVAVEVAVPSVISYVMVSEPLKLASGV